MEELVLKAMQDDDTAYSELISSIQNDLYRVAQARLNNHEDVNYALQQTVIYAYNGIKQLREPKYFKTWIIKILINECNKIYHQNYKKVSIFNRLLNKIIEQENVFADYTNIDEKVDLETILNKLNYEERICIVLFYNSGYSALEIADILHSTENTIRSRIARAKVKIKNMLDKGGVKYEITK